jgi:hypothetical protein
MASGPADQEAGSMREQVSQWILFLVANTLMYRPLDISISAVSNRSIQRLYQFIATGIGEYKK